MKTIKTILLGILFIAVGTLILLFMMDEVSGKTITVNNDGNEDYITIQDAIDEADDGDTIHVYDGNYTENIVVNKSVNLIGNGTQKTIIWNGDYGFDYAVKITADYVIISNFRITCFGIPPTGDGISVQSNHCKIIGNDCEGINYCINIQSSSNCTIENNSCTIINNLYDRHGIGIYLKESDGCIIQNNTCFSTKTYGPYTYGEGIKLYSSNTCCF